MANPQESDEERSGASPTRLELLDNATRRLTAADRSAPRQTAEWMLTEVLSCDRAQLYADANQEVASESAQQFRKMVERRAEGVPLQHILGYASFRGLRVRVSPDVMVPRPETEIVVDRALTCVEDVSTPRVLDVGTGSGCIALALKHERPDADVFGGDVSPEALAMARTNAQELELDVHFFEMDVLTTDIPDDTPQDVDLLVSNPPYIPDAEAESLSPVVREHDPDLSLFAGSDPLRFYRALANWAPVLCSPGASFVFEVHADYATDVRHLLCRAGFAEIHVDEDLSGHPRVVWGEVGSAMVN